jgi:general secretion pathway protein D
MSKLQQNDLLRAREYFVQALKTDPNNGAALINLGVVCEREKKWTEAESYYRQVLALPTPSKGEGSVGEDPLKMVANTALKRLQRLSKGI